MPARRAARKDRATADDEKRELTQEEIDAQSATEMPDREEMSVVGGSLLPLGGAPTFLGPPVAN